MNTDVSNMESSVVSVMEDEDLPDMCAICAAQTLRRQRISANYTDVAEPPKQINHLTGLFGLAGTLFARLEQKNSLKKDACVIYLPVCDACSKKEIEPLRVNFHFKKMTFAVHPNFKFAVEAAQKP